MNYHKNNESMNRYTPPLSKSNLPSPSEITIIEHVFSVSQYSISLRKWKWLTKRKYWILYDAYNLKNDQNTSKENSSYRFWLMKCVIEQSDLIRTIHIKYNKLRKQIGGHLFPNRPRKSRTVLYYNSLLYYIVCYNNHHVSI